MRGALLSVQSCLYREDVFAFHFSLWFLKKNHQKTSVASTVGLKVMELVAMKYSQICL